MMMLCSLEEFDELIEKNKKTMFYFSADWCQDCRYIEPYMIQIESIYNDFSWIKVDRDEFISLCKHLNVYGVPSFIAFCNSKQIGRFVSKIRKTKSEIESFIKSLK